MPGVAEVVAGAVTGLMAGDELPDELQAPVGYDGPWLWLVVGGLVLVAVYYAAVWWLTRTGRSFGGGGIRRRDVPDARREHLLRLDRVEQEVAAGTLPVRVGHQRISETVRSYVGTVSSLPAPTMALADLRAHAPRELVEAVELMYPPEFAPADVGQATKRFAEALHRARRLVLRWS